MKLVNIYKNLVRKQRGELCCIFKLDRPGGHRTFAVIRDPELDRAILYLSCASFHLVRCAESDMTFAAP